MRKNKIFFLGMAILILSLGLVFVGCNTDSDDGDGNSGGGIPTNLVGTWYTDSEFSGDANFKIEADGKFYDQFWYKPEGNLVTCTYTKISETTGKFSNAIGTVLEYKDLTATTLVIVAKGNSINGNVGDTMYKKIN